MMLWAELRESKRYKDRGDFSIQGIGERIRQDFGPGGLDIVVHSLANGPEVKKPLLDTSRKGYLEAVSVSAYSLLGLIRELAPLMAPGGQTAAGGSSPNAAPWPILGAPRTRAVVRSLRKEGKLYLWDWGEVPSPDRVSRTWWPVICSRRATTGPTPAKAPSASTTFATRRRRRSTSSSPAIAGRGSCARPSSRMHACEEGHVLVASAAEALAYLV